MPGSAPVLTVRAPATGELLAEVQSLDADEVQALAARARRAQPGWAALGVRERASTFRRAQRWLVENAERVSSTICAETGKTADDAELEITVAGQSFGFWAKKGGRYLADERHRSTAPLAFGRRVVVRYEPFGVVGVIGPWNYPLVNGFGDCVPALIAGNAVVLKPSEVTPLTALLVAEMMQACGLPDGVFAVAPGAAATGEALVDAVDYVMFTGSARTGQAVMERAARTLTPVSLELGGKDPMIVCSDADVERAANTAAYAGLINAGQVCIAIERVYVEAPVYDRFVTRLTEIVASLRQGAPAGPGEVEVGAITRPSQLEIIERHVDEARQKGARVLTGGKVVEGAGLFYEPTVLVDVDHSMACMREETFGPTIPVMSVADIEEAIRLANDSPYGLQASVFTKDLAKGERIARRLECGAVCVNSAQVNFTVLDVPMGGWKLSGVGSRHGASGIRKYCRTQTIVLTGIAPKRELYQFPYSPRRSRLMAKVTARLYRGSSLARRDVPS
jgi:acyl-CoA reductase-like NAD-dependent aldehyde dehydrogenase